MRKFFALSMALCLAFMLLIGGQTAFADQSVGKPLEIRLKIGAEAITINGQVTRVQKPYVVKGVTMVPLSVITRAFGATLKLEKQTIILKYNGHTIRLTFDNPEVSVDGKMTKLNAAPKVVGGVTMVPLRFISENFGGTVANDAVTGEIVITAMLASGSGTNSTDSGNINVDAGKSKVGDSYYKWSMKYPSGLVQDYVSPANNIVGYADAKDEFLLYVYMKDQAEPLSKEALLKTLVSDLEENEETVVDKKIVDNGKTPYAKAISKYPDGGFTETRTYYSNNYYYSVKFIDKKAKNYKDLDKHKDLLDSFKTSFDGSDRALKDLSNVIDGFRKVTLEDYGITLNVPANWLINKEGLIFGKGDHYMKLKVSSIVDGDTVDKWAGREEKLFTEMFADGFRNVLESKQTTIASVSAIVKKLEYTHGARWWSEYDAFLFKGMFKVYVEFAYPKDESATAEALHDKMISSIAIDSAKMEESFGTIEDEYDFIDKTKTITKSSKKYKYSIQVPEFWNAESVDMDEDTTTIEFHGGYVSVSADLSTVAPYKEMLERILSGYREFEKRDPNFKIVEEKDETYFGVAGKKLVLKGKDDGVPYQEIQYLFEKNGMTYLVMLSMNDSVHTDANFKRMNDVFASMKLTE